MYVVFQFYRKKIEERIRKGKCQREGEDVRSVESTDRVRILKKLYRGLQTAILGSKNDCSS